MIEEKRAKLKLLKESKVDLRPFFAEVGETLSEDEKSLMHDNLARFLTLIEAKKQEYIDSNSNKDEVAKLEDDIKALEEQELSKKEQKVIDDAISKLVEEFKDYDHEKIKYYWNEDMTRKQQQSCNKDTAYDTFKSIYELMSKSESKENVGSEIPNTNDLRAKSSDAIEDEDEEYKRQIGFRR
jgi:glutamate synthase domain-containing protein 2